MTQLLPTLIVELIVFEVIQLALMRLPTHTIELNGIFEFKGAVDHSIYSVPINAVVAFKPEGGGE